MSGVAAVADEVVVYPFTSRRMRRVRVAALCLAAATAATSLLGIPIYNAIIASVIVMAFLIPIHIVVYMFRLDKRSIFATVIDTMAFVTDKRRETITGPWGDVTIISVRFHTTGGIVTSVRAVHPIIWEETDAGKELAIRFRLTSPHRWIAIGAVDDRTLGVLFRQVSPSDRQSW